MTGWFSGHEILIQNTMVYFLLALSIQVPMRMGVFSLGGVGCYAIGGYVTADLLLHGVTGGVGALLISAVGGGVVGCVVAVLVSRVSGLYLGMITLSFVLILGVLAGNLGSITGGQSGLYGVPYSATSLSFLVVCLIAIAIVAASERGRIGRTTETLRTDHLLAASMGIDAGRWQLYALVASGVIGGAAGAMNVMTLGFVAPNDAGFALATTALTMVVLGGRRSWLGALIGAVIIQLLPSVITFLSPTQVVVISGVLVVVVATVMPDGLIGAVAVVWTLLRRAPKRLAGKPPAPTPVPAPAQGAGLRS
jgi:branched-chain amino acid transport system permease protein